MVLKLAGYATIAELHAMTLDELVTHTAYLEIDAISRKDNER